MFTTERPNEFGNVTVVRTKGKVSVDLNGEDALIAFFDERTNTVDRYFGSSADYVCTDENDVTITVYGHNMVPKIDEAPNYAIDDAEGFNSITSVDNLGSGVVNIGYKLASPNSSATIIVVNLFSNQIIGQITVLNQEGSVGFHLSQSGVYAVSLMVNGGSPSSTKKFVVPSF